MNGTNRRLADNRFGKFALGLEARERILEAKLGWFNQRCMTPSSVVATGIRNPMGFYSIRIRV